MTISIFILHIIYFLMYLPHQCKSSQTRISAVTGASVVRSKCVAHLCPSSSQSSDWGYKTISTSHPVNSLVTSHNFQHYCKDNLLDILQYLQLLDYCEYNLSADPIFHLCS